VPAGYQNGYEGDASNADGSAIVTGSADILNGKAATTTTSPVPPLPPAVVDSSTLKKAVSFYQFLLVLVSFYP
jgi:hypothetical protein